MTGSEGDTGCNMQHTALATISLFPGLPGKWSSLQVILSSWGPPTRWWDVRLNDAQAPPAPLCLNLGHE